MKVAVSTVGWLAMGALAGWLAWWAATRSTTAPDAASTIAFGTILLLAWAIGPILIWWRPWLTALSYVGTAVLVLTPEHALPQPALVIAVSAALAVWSLLAGLASWLTARKRAWDGADAQQIAGESQPVPRQVCVVCHGPSDTPLCASCAAALGPDVDAWLGDDC
jgi:mono/diheme cytochrome c family protein